MKKLNSYFKNLQLLFSFLSIFVFLSLPNYTFSQTILYGDSITLGNGVVRTFVRVNALGRREQIGVSMTEGVMNNLDTIGRSFVLALPAPVAADDTTFNHVFFGWNPAGHPPPGIYTLPHFDFHFVTVSVAERQSVIPGPDPVFYPSQYKPLDYYPDLVAIPFHGVHWRDSTAPELNGGTFTKTLIYGFYRGKMFYFEPMITRAYLLTNPDTTVAIKQAQLYRRTGDYPQNYSIKYDAGNQTYNVVLRDFVRSEGVTKNPFIGMSNSKINGVPFSVPPLCGTAITAGYYDSVDFDIIASDWDIGDSVSLTAFFNPAPPAGSIVTFTPILPVTGYPARTHLHFVSNSQYNGTLKLFAADESGNRDSCSIIFDIPLPVELTSFVSTIHENDVTLNWTTASEENNARFEIEKSNVKSQTANDWKTIGFVQGNGTSNLPQSYSYKDKNLSSGRYNYRLKQIDFNGNYEYHNLSHEVVIGVPTRFELSQNYPNPFNPVTVIRYSLMGNRLTTLKVYDITGREVATLVNQIQNAGYYTIDFEGSNYSSGVYFYKLAVEGNIIDTKRMMLLK